jgi:hypothetical protein
MNRIELNGTGNGQSHQEPQQAPRAPRGKAKGKGPGKGPASPGKAPGTPKRAKGALARENVVRWAHRYTLTAVVLSALLNGWSAYNHHATKPADQQDGAFVVGCAALVSALVPLLVWGLSQLAGWLIRAGLRQLAYTAGGVGAGMLLLSVVHVSDAIHLLTGQSLALAVLLAIGIDCGLVVSEVSAIMANDDK